ncbi:hypothetical protein BH23GEM9_BH23GEM9_33410 [soil metagenome]
MTRSPAAGAAVASAMICVAGAVGAAGTLSAGGIGARSSAGYGAPSTAGYDAVADPRSGTHPDGPPPAHTGGFGEPTCHACHFDADANTGPGRLTLGGMPRTAVPDQEYRISILLTGPGMRAAGFQLSARSPDGQPAGVLEVPPEESQRVEVTTHEGVPYAHHRYDGTSPVSRDTARWIVVWRAPNPARLDVVFHAAGISGDGDLSPFGDLVYTAAERTTPRVIKAGSR